MTVRVVTAKEAAERDRTAIAGGIPSRTLMQRAGRGAAIVILNNFPERLSEGAVVFTGPGNNGGDGWVVARAMADAGVKVEVMEVAAAKTADAAAERSDALKHVRVIDRPRRAGIAIDALLGTGAEGEPRGEIAAAIERIEQLAASGATVVALDVPSGLDATTGKHERCVRAELTITFGNVKRGHLLARDVCGEIIAIDIGLGAPHPNDTNPELIDRDWVMSRVPPIRYDAHKGNRGKLAIVAGGPGMPGAAILAARAALRSGIGLVRVMVHESNLAAMANAIPSALISAWPSDDAAVRTEIGEWADALVIGPGLGGTPDTRAMVERILGGTRMPVLLDADALNGFVGESPALGKFLRGRVSIITPHPREMGRLMGITTDEVLATRFDIGGDVVRETGATTLLKGAPTVITGAGGKRYCSARGSAALATGGSGDLLSGIAGALLAQTGDADASACCAAWVHGRAAEICAYVRGTTLDDVLFALPRAWNEREPELEPPVIARIPAVVTAAVAA